ncbi:MAG: hypothetical protein U0610_33520 [bacterium]
MLRLERCDRARVDAAAHRDAHEGARVNRRKRISALEGNAVDPEAMRMNLRQSRWKERTELRSQVVRDDDESEVAPKPASDHVACVGHARLAVQEIAQAAKVHGGLSAEDALENAATDGHVEELLMGAAHFLHLLGAVST